MPSCPDCSRYISLLEADTGVCNYCRGSQILPTTNGKIVESVPQVHDQLPAKSTSSTNYKFALGAGLTVAVLCAIFWFVRQGQIVDAYVDAAAECKAGLGAGRLEALDQLHGKDARPDELRLSLALCAFSQAVDDYNRYDALSKSLSN